MYWIFRSKLGSLKKSEDGLAKGLEPYSGLVEASGVVIEEDLSLILCAPDQVRDHTGI